MLASKVPKNFVSAREPSTVLQTAQPETASPLPDQSRPRRGFSFAWEYVAILLVILLVAGLRFRLREFPLERDEGEYAYAGQLILQGIPPYQLAYNMKLPGTYAAYAAIMAVFGQTAAGIHFGVILVNAASILLVFLIAKHLFDAKAGIVAGATFGLFSVRPYLLGLAGHATHFVTLAALISIYLLLRASGTRRYWTFLSSGICAGLALIMKQPGVFFAAFGLLCLVWRERQPKEGTLFPEVAVYCAGAVLPYLVTCLILLRAGVFQRFWFWTVSYARAYGSVLTAWQGLHEFANRMELQIEHAGVIWFLVVLGMSAFLWDRKIRQHSVFMLSLLGFSFLAASVGLYYRGHYFIVLYPALAMLAGVAVSSTSDWLSRLKLGKVAAVAPVALFVIAVAYALYADRQTYFTDSIHEACRRIYGTNPFPEAVEIGAYIRTNSDESARVAVLGSEPEIYFYAQRHSATGYIYTYPLTEEQAYSSTMQREFIREVESAAPEFVVYVLIEPSWLRHAHSDDLIFRWADLYTRDHYSLVGVADGGGNHDVYRWGMEVPAYRPRRSEIVLVYKRDR